MLDDEVLVDDVEEVEEDVEDSADAVDGVAHPTSQMQLVAPKAFGSQRALLPSRSLHCVTLHSHARPPQTPPQLMHAPVPLVPAEHGPRPAHTCSAGTPVSLFQPYGHETAQLAPALLASHVQRRLLVADVVPFTHGTWHSAPLQPATQTSHAGPRKRRSHKQLPSARHSPP